MTSPICEACGKEIETAKRADAKYHPECRKLYKQKWYLENKERHNAQSKKYYSKNSEQIKQQAREYKANNVATVNEGNRARRSYANLARDKDIEAVYRAARTLTKQTGVQWSVDHIVPLNGKDVSGLHAIHNLQIMTLKANLEKGIRYK